MLKHPSAFVCALITGASSGLGEEFAIQLGPWVVEMVLVARREPLLQSLAERLRECNPGLVVHVVAADLTYHGERERLLEYLADHDLIPDLLVNNAGLGDYGEFASAEWQRIEAMLRLNIDALTHLCHAIVPDMLSIRRGAIINVSSLAGQLPIPDFAVYAASKAYVTSFSEALRIELRDYKIRVLAVCPGPVHTGFGEAARRVDSPQAVRPKWSYVSKDKVVSSALAALAHDRARVYPGLIPAAAAVAVALAPWLLLRGILRWQRQGERGKEPNGFDL